MKPRAALPENFFHDLRAPLARARTFAKLMGDASPAEATELLASLQNALDELERKMAQAEDPDFAG